MSSRSQQLEFYVLDILAKSDHWVGAAQLRQHLMGAGVHVGEATVGRLLRDFDAHGYTRKSGKLGRTLTRRGLFHLERLRLALERESGGRKITAFFSFKEPEALIEVLEARRAIERQTARFAATRATSEQIAAMREAIAAHSRTVSEGSISMQHDVSLHQIIAAASQNDLLGSLLAMIRKDREVAAIVRKARGRQYDQCAKEHEAILAAIERRDPEAAERAMEVHLDGLIAAVRSYARTLTAGRHRGGGRQPSPKVAGRNVRAASRLSGSARGVEGTEREAE